MYSLIRLALLPTLGLLGACATQPSPAPDSAAPGGRTALVPVTGSRIPVPASDSLARAQGAQPVQTVDSQQIELSGQTDTSSALRLLVPSLTVAASASSGGR